MIFFSLLLLSKAKLSARLAKSGFQNIPTDRRQTQSLVEILEAPFPGPSFPWEPTTGGIETGVTRVRQKTIESKSLRRRHWLASGVGKVGLYL